MDAATFFPPILKGTRILRFGKFKNPTCWEAAYLRPLVCIIKITNNIMYCCVSCRKFALPSSLVSPLLLFCLV